MNDQQMDRLIRRLDMSVNPDPVWLSRSLDELLPAARAAKRYDESRLGQLRVMLASLVRLIARGGSRRTILGIAAALLIGGLLITLGAGQQDRPAPGGPAGLLMIADAGGLDGVDPRDGTVVHLLPSTFNVHTVSRSPDGRLVAFRIRDQTGEHYGLMSTDGTLRRSAAPDVTVEPGSCNDSWSPDSLRLVAGVRPVGSSTGRILVIEAGTGEGYFVTPPSIDASCPIWSPDGQSIAYTTGAGALETVRRDGSAVRSVADPAGGATSWSSDGWIYWDSGDGAVRRSNIVTGTSQTISRATIGRAFAPALSPDGEHLAFLYWRDATQSFDLYLGEPDGTGATRVLSNVLVFGGWSRDGADLLVVWAPIGGIANEGGLVTLGQDGSRRMLLMPFSAGCPPTVDSPCFRDIAWGQSRP
jgi:hypothetical protein